MTTRLPVKEGVEATAPLILRLNPTAGFGPWLAKQGGFLAFTTLAAQTLAVLTAGDDGALRVSLIHVGFARGLAADAEQFWVGGDTRLWRFGNVGPRVVKGVAFDAAYVLRAAHFVGQGLLHDVARDVTLRGERHEVVFADTKFSVIATLDANHAFRPLWAPKFISRLAPEDRCHLNSFAILDGEVAYATVFSQTDVREGWRGAGAHAGAVIDVASGETICAGLSAPHTPRWYRGRLWLANSGPGAFGFIDLAAGRFEAVATLGGFVRGFAMIGDYALVAMSSRRPASLAQAPEIPGLARVEAKTSGLFVIDLRSGAVAHAMTIAGADALYEVVHVPGLRRPLFVKTPEDPAELEEWTTFSAPGDWRRPAEPPARP